MSVGIDASCFTNVNTSVSSDLSFSYSLQPNLTLSDEKPLDDLFHFESFPEGDAAATTGADVSLTALADSSEFFSQSFFDQPAVNPYGLSDSFDAKHFDLQTAPGAPNGSDGTLAAEV